MEDLIDWLRDALSALERQLDEDERIAKAAEWSGDERWQVLPGHDQPFHRPWQVIDTYDEGVVQVRAQAADDESVAVHVARWDPKRVLDEVADGRADIAAKRQILDAYAWAVHMHRVMSETNDDGKWDWLFKEEALEGVVRLLAQPLAAKPGFRDEWRADV